MNRSFNAQEENYATDPVANQEPLPENQNVQNLYGPRVLEIATSTPASLLAALESGADRIELCAALTTGGLTPDQAFIEYAVSTCITYRVPVVIMIRPRPGSFVYDSRETTLMLRSIALARDAGASGLVGGALLRNGRIDPVQTQRFVEAAEELPFTFHRAFDQSPEQEKDFDLLHQLGVQRLLTGGQQGPASPEALRRLAQHSQGRISLIAAGGLRPTTLLPLLEIPGLREFHSAATAAATATIATPTAAGPATKQPLTLESSAYAGDPEADSATVSALKELIK